MKKSKLLSLLFTAAMIMSLLPTAAFADEIPAGAGYVLMDIPYNDFYAAEVGSNDVEVDAVTSATLNKPRTGTLAGGSYHTNGDGTDITGIIYPVYVEDLSVLSEYTQVTDDDTLTITVTNRGQENTTTYTGAETLFENDSYSYYYLGTELPGEYKSYKTLTVVDGELVFSAVSAQAETAEGVTATLETNGNHTYYEISVEGMDKINENISTSVSAVTLTTKEGAVYGLRHVYEIWRGTELGFDVTGDNAISAAIQGQTISEITYYLTDGSVYSFSTELKVPYSSESLTLTVAAAAVDAGKTAISVELSDFDPQYTVTRDDEETALKAAGSEITWTDTQLPGEYTLTATDGNGKYAPITTTFVLSTDTAVATYDAEKTSLVAAEGASAESFAAYLKGITSVSVDGTAYSASGRNAVTIINTESGLVMLDAKSGDNDVFTAGTHELVISSTGYPDLTISVVSTQGANPFTDVASGDYYYDAVLWAVQNGVTTGTSDTTFSPAAACTRAQAVTFLWRANGSPEPEEGENPFTDVAEDAYYYKAVLWAVQNGITTGTSKTTFSPDDTVVRAQVVTFLYRAAGSPETAEGAEFTDVAADAYYAGAVAWAVSESVTTGTSDTTFSPSAACTRGQIVTFMYRDAK